MCSTYLQVHPHHNAVAVMRARNLARLGMVGEAKTAFARIPLRLLRPAARYDYARVSYIAGDFALAKRLFRSIPPSRPYTEAAQNHAEMLAIKARAPAEPAAPEETYEGFKSVTKTNTLTYSDTREHDYNHGYSNVLSETKVSCAKFANGWMTSGKQGALGLQLTLGGEDRITTGSKLTNIADGPDASVTRQLAEKTDQPEVRSALANADVWAELRAPFGLWLTVGAKVDARYPDFTSEQKSATRSEYLDLAQHSGIGDLIAEVSYTQVVDQADRSLTDIASFSLSTESEFTKSVLFATSASYDSYHYLGVGKLLDGPANSSKFDAALIQLMPLKAKLTLGATYQGQQQYLVQNVDDLGPILANGRTYAGRLALSAHPFSIFSVKIGETLSHNEWQSNDPDRQTALHKATAQNIDEQFFEVGIRVDF